MRLSLGYPPSMKPVTAIIVASLVEHRKVTSLGTVLNLGMAVDVVVAVDVDVVVAVVAVVVVVVVDGAMGAEGAHRRVLARAMGTHRPENHTNVSSLV